MSPVDERIEASEADHGVHLVPAAGGPDHFDAETAR